MARGPNRNLNPALTCMFSSREGHTAATCREYQLVQRDPSEIGRSGNGNGNTTTSNDNERYGGGVADAAVSNVAIQVRFRASVGIGYPLRYKNEGASVGIT